MRHSAKLFNILVYMNSWKKCYQKTCQIYHKWKIRYSKWRVHSENEAKISSRATVRTRFKQSGASTQKLSRNYTGYLCDIHTKKSGTSSLRKLGKMCGIPHNLRIMYSLKRGMEDCAFRTNDIKFVGQSLKIYVSIFFDWKTEENKWYSTHAKKWDKKETCDIPLRK